MRTSSSHGAGRALAFLLAGGLLAGLGGCAAPKPPALPQGLDLVYPAPASPVPVEVGRGLQRGWRALRQGDTARAEKEYRVLLAARPGLVPAETGLAYVRLRAGLLDAAAAGFDAVLLREPGYVPALVGAGSTASRRGDPETALELFRRAQATGTREAVVARRLGELKLQVTERRVAAAREALATGDRAAAIGHFRVALGAAPELAELRVELADALAAEADPSGAIAVLEAAPAPDRRVQLRLARLLSAQGEPARALSVLRQLLAADADDGEARREADAIRAGLEMQQMPAEYRRIAEAPRITRADLAALLSVKLTALGRLPAGTTKVATDVSGSWARGHILRLLALGLLELYPNHTFQPAAIVRRGDLAAAVGRVLDLLGMPQRPAPVLRDMSPAHLQYSGAVRAVSAGLMDVSPDGSFQPWRPVSGPDAIAVVEGLARIVGP
ncbi:MAG: tetratricopeptide repeat protein [Vicinamibacteria bacterium]